MRHGMSGRRSRNRGHGSNNGGGGNNGGQRHGGTPHRSQVFDSNGPDVRIRGTAFQIQEKYMALAKDAASSGDRVMAESYLQHAEHYQRMINEWNAQAPRVEARQPTDSFDQAFDPARQEQPDVPAIQPQPRQRQNAEDLGLPSSILGPKRDAPNPEMNDA